MGVETMRAITILQPWASLLACGAKRYETRSWATRYRGPIAIHAGKKKAIDSIHSLDWSTMTIMARVLGFFPDDGLVRNQWSQIGVLNSLPHGAIIATAELVGCWEIRSGMGLGFPIIYNPYERQDIVGDEYLFGDWTPGRYAWQFANMKILETPIPTRGYQGLWTWRKSE